VITGAHCCSKLRRYAEQAKTKCIGITIETRPDYCLKPHLRCASPVLSRRLVRTGFDIVLSAARCFATAARASRCVSLFSPGKTL